MIMKQFNYVAYMRFQSEVYNKIYQRDILMKIVADI